MKDNKTEEVRVAFSSGGLREKLQRFEGDLHEIASRNVELRSEVDAMRATLSDSQTEKDRVAQARAMLGDRLQEVEDALAEVRGEKRQLEMTVGELRSDIEIGRAECRERVCQCV